MPAELTPDPGPDDLYAVVAGWEDPRSGEWHNVEKGGPEPSESDLARSGLVSVHVSTPSGEDFYFSTGHITADFDIYAILDDWSAAGYFGEFV